MPLCFGASASVRARHTPQSANCAYEVQTFWPLRTHPPSTAEALVDTEAKSEPAPGSLNSWHHSSSAERIFDSHRAFCSCDPCASSVGPARFTPIRPTSSGARARASSSCTTKCSAGPSPRPPYSDGQATPTHRPPAHVDCHSRKKATSESKSSNRGGNPTPYSHGRLACSHERTSWRSASCSGVGERSTARRILTTASYTPARLYGLRALRRSARPAG